MIKIIQREVQFKNDTKDFSEVSKGSHKKVEVECPECHIHFKKEIRYIHKDQHTYCQKCCYRTINKKSYIGMIVSDFECVSEEEGKVIIKCLQCDNQKKVTVAGFRKGITHKQCGKDLKMYGTQFYSIWANMRTRTTNPNYEKWDRYGGRGIKSDDFKYFADFYRDMYPSYLEHVEKHGEEDTTIDRIDNDKDYTKENCRWLTWKKQAGNKSSNMLFTAISPQGNVYDGKNLKKFCEQNELNYKTIGGRLSTIKCDKPYKNRKSGWVFIRKSETTIEK